MIPHFDDRLLGEFADSFYGYGDYAGRFWFVGMEEGGGGSFKEVYDRLNSWHIRGRRELEDAPSYHTEINIPHLFNDHPKLEPTWAKLIRIVLSTSGAVPTTEQVRAFQRDSWGRIYGDNCLLELLPLPSRSLNDWLYANHSNLSYLANRDIYLNTLLAPRIAHVRNRIHEYRPRVVVFYGRAYEEYWHQIANVEITPNTDGVNIGHDETTLYLLLPHPTAHGLTNDYFHQIGSIISSQWSNR